MVVSDAVSALFTMRLYGLKLEALLSPFKLRVVAATLPVSHSRARSPWEHSWDAMSTRDPPHPKKGVSPAGCYSTGQTSPKELHPETKAYVKTVQGR